MQIDIATIGANPNDEVRVGNVYNVRGGRGLRYGHMMIVIAIVDPQDRYDGRSVLLLTVTKEGKPVGVTQYALHYLEDKCPIAFCEGIDQIQLTIRSL